MNREKLFRAAIVLHITIMLLYFGVVAYRGVFTRYMSDDYCEAVSVNASSPVSAVIERYTEGQWRAASRYTNLFFVGITEFAGPSSIPALPALMILLWLAGMTWFLMEFNETAGFGWLRYFAVYLAFLAIFAALLQAPNLYQILYWRSSMATHFAPVVFLFSLLAYLTFKARARAPVWTGPLLLMVAFMIGGFSEPPMAVMVTGLGLALVFVWFIAKDDTRIRWLSLLSWTFAGALLSLLVMALAPSTTGGFAEASISPFTVLERSFRYGIEFILDWFQNVPLPALFIVASALLVFAGFYSLPLSFRPLSQKVLLTTLMAAPLIAYLLIVASFAPSAYGQSFPVERARFSAQLCLVLALMIEGAALGILLVQWKPRIIQSLPVTTISAVLLMLAALYPLRAAWRAWQEVPEYRERAEQWDARDAFVRRHMAQGEMDLVVPELPGYHYVKEWDALENHWVNRCVAHYYGLNSIRTVPVEEEDLMDLFNE